MSGIPAIFLVRKVRGANGGRGFALVELMVALTIVAMLAALAFPAFARMRQSARQTRFVADLRAYVSFFQVYQMRYGDWPADAAPGDVPLGLMEEMPAGWRSGSPLGGVWQWTSVEGVKAIVLHNHDGTDADFAKIDAKIDDGESGAGAFRVQGASWVHSLY